MLKITKIILHVLHENINTLQSLFREISNNATFINFQCATGCLKVNCLTLKYKGFLLSSNI